MTSSIAGIGASSMQRPDPKDFFRKIDSDSSGDISQSELQALSDKMKEVSGNTLDASAEAFSGYDSDGSGSLSDDELKAVMENSGFGPARGMEGMPPPPPGPEQAVSSYSENSGEDTLSSVVTTLKKLLDAQSQSSSNISSSSSSSSDDLIKQLQTLLDKLSKSYASKNLDSGDSLLSITG